MTTFAVVVQNEVPHCGWDTMSGRGLFYEAVSDGSVHQAMKLWEFFCAPSSLALWLLHLYASWIQGLQDPTPGAETPAYDLFNRKSSGWKHIFIQTLRNAMAISLNASPLRVWTTFSCLLWEVTFSSHPDYLEAFSEMHLKSLALFWNPVR